MTPRIDSAWEEIRKSTWWSFGAAVGGLVVEAGALTINAIVVARNGIRLATAELNRAAVRLREKR